jgi:hypothetical protein
MKSRKEKIRNVTAEKERRDIGMREAFVSS